MNTIDKSHLDSIDNTFKTIITAGWNVKSDGDVQSPTGHFALVEIPLHAGELAEMLDACDLDPTQHAIPMEGWYVVRENNDGLVEYFGYPHSGPGKREAEAQYARHERDFSSWMHGAEDVL